MFFVKRNVLHKFLSPVFSSKGAKPTLKKSESLFHKERIDLVFKKVKRAIVLYSGSLLTGRQERKREERIPTLIGTDESEVSHFCDF